MMQELEKTVALDCIQDCCRYIGNNDKTRVNEIVGTTQLVVFLPLREIYGNQIAFEGFNVRRHAFTYTRWY